MTEKPNYAQVFIRRRRNYTLCIVAVLALFFTATTVTQFSTLQGIQSLPKALLWIAQNLVPDADSLHKLPAILGRLKETVLLSVAVTVTAAVCAFFLSLFGTSTTKMGGSIGRFVRIFAAFFRNVPDVVWAMLLMFSFGQNILTGFFALFFTTFGLLTRAFIESIDEVSGECVEALQASGASFFQVVFQAILPSSVTEIITWVLYMIETNIRSSTLIGILTATGIGYTFDLYYKRLDYATASLVVLSIIVAVLMIEVLSNHIRKVIA